VGLDLAQVGQQPKDGALVNGIVLLAGAGQRVGHVNRVERPRVPAPRPDGEATIVVLQGLQGLDVLLDGGVDLLGRRQALGLEGLEHVPQRGHRQHAGRDLLRALVGVGDQVEHRVGQGLQRRGRGADLQAAELGVNVRGRGDRLRDGALVHNAIGGKGLGRRRSVHRQRDLRGIRPLARRGAHQHARCAGLCGSHRELHLDAVAGRDGDGDARLTGQGEVRDRHGHVHVERGVGLVLQHDGQRQAVTIVQEARRRRAHSQGQPRRQGGLGLAIVALAGDDHGHDAVAREVIGHGHGHLGCAVRVRRSGRAEERQRVEVAPHANGSSRPGATFQPRGCLFGHGQRRRRHCGRHGCG